MMAKFLRRRRLWSLLIFIAISGSIFLCFQLFSLNVISNQTKVNLKQIETIKKVKAQMLPRNCIEGEDCDEGDDTDNFKPDQNGNGQKLAVDTGQVFPINNFIDDALKEAVVLNKMEKQHIQSLLERGSLPRGIALKNATLYVPDAKNQFTCISDKINIPYDQVNDEYCDCADGSDEPGTSACPGNRFYCKFQLDHDQATWIWSSYVNDGICDCCDGSDEWQDVKLPAHVQLGDQKKHNGVYQEPCSNHCGELEAKKLKAEETRRNGLKIKQSYIQEARDDGILDKIYGSDGAFYPVSKHCHTQQQGEYNYRVCPFHQIHQEAIPHGRKNIGRTSHWQKTDKYAGFKLRVSGGDRDNCPQQKSRESLIIFECGEKDGILTIEENERCSYIIHFETPAACQ